jgi:hypothetical protein
MGRLIMVSLLAATRLLGSTWRGLACRDPPMLLAHCNASTVYECTNSASPGMFQNPGLAHSSRLRSRTRIASSEAPWAAKLYGLLAVTRCGNQWKAG